MVKKDKQDPLNNITLELDKPQTGKIKVHTEIIDDLSSGIYSSPASCIKELVNNSYDANAELVSIRIKPVLDTIVIVDDGDGMNAEDFDNNFAWISKSNKRNNGDKNGKRPLIGKIGIGFIAVNEICESLEVISSKRGESFKFKAKIDFKKFREEDIELDGGIIKGEFDLINSEEDKQSHYTIIRLIGLREHVVQNVLKGRSYIHQENEKESKKKVKTNNISLFKSMKDILLHYYDDVDKRGVRDFKQLNPYLQFIIDLSSYIPVEYIEEGPFPFIKEDEILNKIIKSQKDLNFKVELDGIYLKKPVFFPKYERNFTFNSFEDTIQIPSSKEHIRIRGYFFAQHKTLSPLNFNGLSIKIKNVPIAERFGFESSFMDYPFYTGLIFRNWLMGEIYVLDGLEDAMNIDRKSFRKTHPHYVALQEHIHKYLNEFFISEKILNMYKEDRTRKEKVRDKKSKTINKKILSTDKVTFEVNKPIKRQPESSKKESKKIANKKTNENSKKIEVNYSSKETKIIVSEEVKKLISKKDNEYLQPVLILFEKAFNKAKGDTTILKKEFYEGLYSWLKERKK